LALFYHISSAFASIWRFLEAKMKKYQKNENFFNFF